ncbi:MAG: hypothetical protein LUF81_02775 [Clostridiales bacterium]|nr:hypothetical protein [Clostridiales bacterium]
MNRNYVALPYEYLEEMEALSDEEFGLLCRGLLQYSMEGTPIQPEGNLRFFTRRVMSREDRFQEGFADQQRKRSQAGKKGAEARWGASASPESDGNTMAPDSDAMPADSTAMAPDDKNGQTETKAKAKTKTKTETETDTKAEAETKTKTDTEAGEEAKADPKLKNKLELEDEGEPKALPAAAGERNGPAVSAPTGADHPPTREEVLDFLQDRGLRIDGERFWDYYQARNWRTRNGKPMDWRRRAEHWAETQWGPGGQVVPLRPTEAQRRAENRANIEEMRRALERMKASG